MKALAGLPARTTWIFGEVHLTLRAAADRGQRVKDAGRVLADVLRDRLGDLGRGVERGAGRQLDVHVELRASSGGKNSVLTLVTSTNEPTSASTASTVSARLRSAQRRMRP